MSSNISCLILNINHSAPISRRGGGGVVCCASIVNHCEMGSNPEPLAVSFVHNLAEDRGACAQKGAAKKKQLKVLEGITHTTPSICWH